MSTDPSDVNTVVAFILISLAVLVALISYLERRHESSCPILVLCPDCHGAGEFRVPFDGSASGGYVILPCKRCSGKGCILEPQS